MPRNPTPAPGRPVSPWSLVVLGPVLLLAALLPACDPGFPGPQQGDTIPEDAFVEAMADLRRAAAAWEGRRLPEPERDSILEAHGLEPEDLLHFVEIHGTDVLYMNRVWARVEAAFTARDRELQEGDPEPQGDPEPGLDPGTDPETDRDG
jgi:hypothetical protein